MKDTLSILLLDDDIESLESLKMALEAKGYNITKFQHPKQALDEFSKSEFDVVVTDLKMPGINGLEVLKRVKKIDSQVVVMLITAFADEENCRQAYDAGAYAFFPKPLNLKAFLNTLSEVKETLSVRDVNENSNKK